MNVYIYIYIYIYIHKSTYIVLSYVLLLASFAGGGATRRIRRHVKSYCIMQHHIESCYYGSVTWCHLAGRGAVELGGGWST